MMYPRGLALAALALGLVFASSGWAQERREGGPGGGGFGRGFGFGGAIDKVALVGSDQVRKEIKVADEQAKKLDEILTAHGEAQRGLFQGRGDRDASAEEREKRRAESQTKIAALSKETEGKIDAALQAEQLTRLNEIVLQQKGVDALRAEPLLTSLKISKEQTEKIQTALKGRDDELAKIFPRGVGGRRGGGDAGGNAGGGERPNFEEIREKSDKVRKATEKSVLALITQEQVEAFEKAKGKPFELDRSTLRRGGPGGRGGAPGRERRRPAGDNEI